MSQADSVSSWPLNEVLLLVLASPPARWSFPFLFPLHTFQAEEAWLPGRPRAKLNGGRDKTGEHHRVGRAPLLKPDRGQVQIPILAPAFCETLGQTFHLQGPQHPQSSLPSKDVIKIRNTECEVPGKFLTNSKFPPGTRVLEVITKSSIRKVLPWSGQGRSRKSRG